MKKSKRIPYVNMENIKSYDSQCVSGCIVFTGGEIKHHKDCPYYPESLTEMYEKLKEDKAELLNALIKSRDLIKQRMGLRIKEMESLIQKHK